MSSSQKPILHIAILGAGGIGCYYGAKLQFSGHKVSFIARGEHLAAMQSSGLELSHPDFEFKEKIDAYSLEALTKQQRPADFDAIVICVKTTATSEIAETLRQWFENCQQETVIISLQNGVDNESQLAKSLGDDVVLGGLAVRIGGHIIRPGMVEATGEAQVVLGAWPHKGSPADKRFSKDLSHVVDAFNQAHIPTRKVDNIRHELWRKLVINNGVNPLSALTGLDTYEMSHDPYFGPIVHHMMKETAQVAVADNEILTEQDADDMFELIRSFDPIKTSMLVDLEKGRALELDAMSGAVIERGMKLGISLPYTETVYALLKHTLEKNASSRFTS